jgi:hypothetical protein
MRIAFPAEREGRADAKNGNKWEFWKVLKAIVHVCTTRIPVSQIRKRSLAQNNSYVNEHSLLAHIARSLTCPALEATAFVLRDK